MEVKAVLPQRLVDVLQVLVFHVHVGAEHVVARFTPQVHVGLREGLMQDAQQLLETGVRRHVHPKHLVPVREQKDLKHV